METDGALLNLPFFLAGWGGGKGQKPGSRGDQARAMWPNTTVFVCVLLVFPITKPDSTKTAFRVLATITEKSALVFWKDDLPHSEAICPLCGLRWRP